MSDTVATALLAMAVIGTTSVALSTPEDKANSQAISEDAKAERALDLKFEMRDHIGALNLYWQIKGLEQGQGVQATEALFKEKALGADLSAEDSGRYYKAVKDYGDQMTDIVSVGTDNVDQERLLELTKAESNLMPFQGISFNLAPSGTLFKLTTGPGQVLYVETTIVNDRLASAELALHKLGAPMMIALALRVQENRMGIKKKEVEPFEANVRPQAIAYVRALSRETEAASALVRAGTEQNKAVGEQISTLLVAQKEMRAERNDFFTVSDVVANTIHSQIMISGRPIHPSHPALTT